MVAHYKFFFPFLQHGEMTNIRFRPCAMDDGTKNYLFNTLQEVIIVARKSEKPNIVYGMAIDTWMDR